MKKRIISTVLLSIMLAAVAAGCSNGENKTENGEVVINWTMPGPGVQTDSEMVWEEFNKQLKTYEGLENVSVKFDVISSADYAQKFLMAQTGGDKMDIVQTYTLDFVTEARNGTFAPLDKYLDDELKQTKEELPEFIFKYGEVDGNIYAITNYQMCPSMWALNIDKKIADKYMDVEKLKEVLSKPDTSNEIYAILEEMMSKAAANGDLGKGFYTDGGMFFATRDYTDVWGNFVINTYGDDKEVKFKFQLPEVKTYYDRLADWYNKGYIRKDILSISDAKADMKRDGGFIAWVDNSYSGHNEIVTSDGYEYYSFYIFANPVIPTTNAAGAIAIAASSEHKDIAARIINLMNCEQGKDLYNLLVWGLEGVHYNKIGEDRIETIGYTGQGNSNSPYGLWKWVVGNSKLAPTTQAEEEDYKEFVFDELNEGENTIVSKILGFKADLTNYQSNTSQINTVVKEYGSLGHGAVTNHEKVYQEYMDKLEICGIEEVKAELQKQVDAFLAESNE